MLCKPSSVRTVALLYMLLNYVSGLIPLFPTLKFIYLRIVCTLGYALRWKGTIYTSIAHVHAVQVVLLKSMKWVYYFWHEGCIIITHKRYTRYMHGVPGTLILIGLLLYSGNLTGYIARLMFM